jgi:hypothetical protein
LEIDISCGDLRSGERDEGKGEEKPTSKEVPKMLSLTKDIEVVQRRGIGG